MNEKDYFNYELLHKDKETGARAGLLKTPHGEIETPIFMPVGTNSSVKSLTCDQIRDTQAQIILSNSYHLYLRAGTKRIRDFGGIHGWMNWDKPVLTDSGGFQVFSLAHLRKITEDGVEFRDPKDGTKHFISPEVSMEIQQDIGADIIMAFDECAPYPCDYKTAKAAMERTHRWLERCFKAKTNPKQALFPIVQGAFYEDLREIDKNNTVLWKPYFLSDNDLYKEIKNADIIVLPYRAISQSGVLLLSLFFEKLIITSNLPSFVETLSSENEEINKSIFFESENENQLEQLIRRYVDGQVNTNLIYEHLMNLKNSYSWKSAAIKTFEIYHIIIGVNQYNHNEI